MNIRLLRHTLCITVLPLIGIFLMLSLQENRAAMGLVLALTTLLQVPVILLSKRSVRTFIRPDLDVLKKMDVDYMPAAYQPKKLKVDTRLASAAVWLNPAAPVLLWLAIRTPRHVSVSVLNFAGYTAPSLELVAVALVSLLVGTLALPFWFEAARAHAIYAESSDQKRYLLRGFAERLNTKPGAAREYLNACKGIETRDFSAMLSQPIPTPANGFALTLPDPF